MAGPQVVVFFLRVGGLGCDGQDITGRGSKECRDNSLVGNVPGEIVRGELSEFHPPISSGRGWLFAYAATGLSAHACGDELMVLEMFRGKNILYRRKSSGRIQRSFAGAAARAEETAAPWERIAMQL